jgi:hypothetical protein
MKKLHADFGVLDADFKGFFQRLVEIVNVGMTNYSVSNTILQHIDIAHVFNTFVDGTLEATTSQQSISYDYQVPEIPNFVLDLKNRIDHVKQILLQNDVNIVGVNGMGGSGKTSLASSFCDDRVEGNNISSLFKSVLQTFMLCFHLPLVYDVYRLCDFQNS